MRIVLPWIDSKLLPNQKNGRVWQASQAAKNQAKRDAKFATLAAQQSDPYEFIKGQNIQVAIWFQPPDSRWRDVDGMLSALKPSLDSIAETMGVDDHLFREIHLYRCNSYPGGQVVIELDQLPF